MKSRAWRPSPYTGTGWPSSRFVAKSGIIFSGYWYGPYVFEPRVIIASAPYVRTEASTCRSPPALAAEYGDDGRSGVALLRGLARLDVAVDLVGRDVHGRPPCSRIQSSSAIGPSTLVVTNSVPAWIERSTCVSAAKLTIASAPSAASAIGVAIRDGAMHEAVARIVGDVLEVARGSPRR